MLSSRRGTAVLTLSTLAVTSAVLLLASPASAAVGTTVKEFASGTGGTPYDIAVDSNGSFWVTEPGTGRLAHHAKDGTLTAAAGQVSLGEVNLGTKGLTGVAVSGDHVVVTDPTNNLVYDYVISTGAVTSLLTTKPSSVTDTTGCITTGPSAPTDVVVGKNGYVYITFRTGNKVVRYNPSTTPHVSDDDNSDCVSVPTTPGTTTPAGVTVPGTQQMPLMLTFAPASQAGGADGLYYTDNNGGSIGKVVLGSSSSTTTGFGTASYVTTVQSTGTGATNQPYGISWTPVDPGGKTGAVYYDYESAEENSTAAAEGVGRFTVSTGTDSAPTTLSLRSSSSDTTLRRPLDVATDSLGYAYVSLNATNRVARVNPTVTTIGLIASGITGAAAPRGILFDGNDGQMWFTENGTNKIASLNRLNVASATVVSGSGQAAGVDSDFAAQLVATVVDPDGNSVPGADVVFSAPTSGPSATFGAGGSNSQTVTADDNGRASTRTLLHANLKTGSYVATATPQTAGATTASYSLTNTPGAVTQLAKTSGDNQSTQASTQFNAPLKVTTQDKGGNAANSGQTVTFVINANGSATGTFNGTGSASGDTATRRTVTADANGVATSPLITAGSSKGSFTVTASTSGASSVTFTENISGAPAAIAASTGSNQSTAVSTAFSAPLVAKVVDSDGNPVQGVLVTFTAPASGASGTFSTGTTGTSSSGQPTTVVTTDDQGLATASFTANATGSQSNAAYQVTAAYTGSSTSATFNLKNFTAAKTISQSPASQTAGARSAFPAQPTARVQDANGTDVSGASVTFTVSGSPTAAPSFTGNSSSFTAATGYDGTATAGVLTAGSAPGSYTLSAVTGSLTATTTTYTVTAGVVASLTKTAGDNQSTAAGTAFGKQLAVVAKDADGNVVANVGVVFTAPASGASGTFGSGSTASRTVTVQTDSTGTATAPALTANGTAGTFTVTASNNGVTASFTETNAAASVTGTPSAQGTITRATFGSPLQVTAKDASGNALVNSSVTFTLPTAAGTFGNGTQTFTTVTDSNGMATSQVITAGTTPGSYTATASVNGTTVSYTLNVLAQPANRTPRTGPSSKRPVVTSGHPVGNRATVTVRGQMP